MSSHFRENYANMSVKCLSWFKWSQKQYVQAPSFFFNFALLTSDLINFIFKSKLYDSGHLSYNIGK